MACSTAIVSCPEIADISITYGVKTPANPTGTVTFFPGGTGTNVATANAQYYIPSYSSAGLQTVQLQWASDWALVSPPSVSSVACRPATFLQYVHDSVSSGGFFAAHGFSGGAASLGYALALYGEDEILNTVELISGPGMSNLDDGCEVPSAGVVTIVPTNGASWQDSPTYSGQQGMLTAITGYSCLPKKGTTSQQADAAWGAQSVVQTGGNYNYATKLSGWVCNNALNNSEAQAYLFFPP